MSRHCFEATFSSNVRLARDLSGQPVGPLEVTFTWPEPESRAEYERIFQCPIRFSHKDSGEKSRQQETCQDCGEKFSVYIGSFHQDIRHETIFYAGTCKMFTKP